LIIFPRSLRLQKTLSVIAASIKVCFCWTQRRDDFTKQLAHLSTQVWDSEVVMPSASKQTQFAMAPRARSHLGSLKLRRAVTLHAYYGPLCVGAVSGCLYGTHRHCIEASAWEDKWLICYTQLQALSVVTLSLSSIVPGFFPCTVLRRIPGLELSAKPRGVLTWV